MNEMAPANVKSSIYIDFNVEKNDEDSQFKVGDLVRISKYKCIFVKGDIQNWSEEVLWLKKLKILCCGHMLFAILTVKKFLERFMKKNCKREIKQSLELKM